MAEKKNNNKPTKKNVKKNNNDTKKTKMTNKDKAKFSEQNQIEWVPIDPLND
ncbi:MAG: hypothetical protein IKI20_01210 [Lachnospiraceae bacterium]|nr:hypothetical protein [Lachnospiraceae bacterium]